MWAYFFDHLDATPGSVFTAELAEPLGRRGAGERHQGEAGRRLAALASLMPVMPFGEFYGVIRALEAKREMIGNNHLWIAAPAKAASLTLVTKSQRKFKQVPGLTIQNGARQSADSHAPEVRIVITRGTESHTSS